MGAKEEGGGSILSEPCIHGNSALAGGVISCYISLTTAMRLPRWINGVAGLPGG